MKYTFTFPYDQEPVFNGVLGRLESDEFTIIESIHPVEVLEGQDIRWVDRETIIEMDPMAASTFRMRMGNNLKIRRERTEEELAAEKEENDRHTIKVTVHVPMGDSSAP
jgi:hypothetical protein